MAKSPGKQPARPIHTYVIRTFVEARTIEEALRTAKRTAPHDAYILGDPIFKKEAKELPPCIGFNVR